MSRPQQLFLDKTKILDYLQCPKKFFLLHGEPSVLKAASATQPLSLLPSLSDIVSMQDGLEFQQLCCIWDTHTVDKRAVRIKESDFDQAHVRTAEVVNQYFHDTFRKLGASSPPLLLHRPALRSVTQVAAVGDSSPAARALELRARPALLHFHPKTAEWRLHHCKASTSVADSRDVLEKLVHGMIYDMFTLRSWGVHAAHILSDDSRKHLAFQASMLAGSDGPKPHVNPWNSGLLYIRNYTPGPVTLTHHDTRSLNQFIVRLAIQQAGNDLVGKSAKRCGGGGGGDRQQADDDDGGDAAPTAHGAKAWTLDGALDRMQVHVDSAAAALVGPHPLPGQDALRALSLQGSQGFADFLRPSCAKGCPLYAAGYCLPSATQATQNGSDVTAVSVFDVTRVKLSTKVSWWNSGITTLGVLAKHAQPLKPSPAVQRFLRSVSAGGPLVNPAGVSEWMKSLRYPLFLLDFESSAFALPPFDGTRSYQAIPFQYSMDVFHNDILTETPVHYEYLHIEQPGASVHEDPRRPCLTSLMIAIRHERSAAKSRWIAGQSKAATATNGDSPRTTSHLAKGMYKGKQAKIHSEPWDGTIVSHFAVFEQQVLRKLSLYMEEYRDEIKNMVFADTIDLLRRSLVHPRAMGSFSLKKVVPALLDETSHYVAFQSNASLLHGFGGSEDASGSVASALYRLWRLRGDLHVEYLSDDLRAAQQQITKAGWQILRGQLLNYCAADTRNMYLVVRAVDELRHRAIASGNQQDDEGWVEVAHKSPISLVSSDTSDKGQQVIADAPSSAAKPRGRPRKLQRQTQVV